jgi:hypothetical protein
MSKEKIFKSMKNKRIISIFIVFAMTVSLIPMTASADTPVIAENIPNHVDLGDFTIGFFNFVDGRGTHLEIRFNGEIHRERITEFNEDEYDKLIFEKTRQIFEEFNSMSTFEFMSRMRTKFAIYINQPFTMSGISRVRATVLDDDYFGGPVAEASTDTLIRVFGWVTADFGFIAGDRILQAQVDGTGIITFAEGDFIFKIGDTLHEIDLNGIVLSNLFSCCNADCLIGDVNGDGTVTIDDASEILKYLAGIRHFFIFNNISMMNRAMNHALILPASREAGSPTINDALEIIKALAGLPSMVTRLNKA